MPNIILVAREETTLTQIATLFEGVKWLREEFLGYTVCLLSPQSFHGKEWSFEEQPEEGRLQVTYYPSDDFLTVLASLYEERDIVVTVKPRNESQHKDYDSFVFEKALLRFRKDAWLAFIPEGYVYETTLQKKRQHSYLIGLDERSQAQDLYREMKENRLFQKASLYFVYAAGERHSEQLEKELDLQVQQLKQGGWPESHFMLLEGEAEKVLSDFTYNFDVDALFIGGTNHSLLYAFLFGSTSQYLIATSNLPILLLT